MWTDYPPAQAILIINSVVAAPRVQSLSGMNTGVFMKVKFEQGPAKNFSCSIRKKQNKVLERNIFQGHGWVFSAATSTHNQWPFSQEKHQVCWDPSSRATLHAPCAAHNLPYATSPLPGGLDIATLLPGDLATSQGWFYILTHRGWAVCKEEIHPCTRGQQYIQVPWRMVRGATKIPSAVSCAIPSTLDI